MTVASQTQNTNGRRPRGPRMIALVGPFQSGKTSLMEAMLYRAGAVSRQGRVADKTTLGDASTEARAHAMGVELNTATMNFMGESFTLVDCPGSVEFAQDSRAVLPACDAAIVVCEADVKKVAALQVILKELDDLKVPHFIFINKVDKSEASPRDVLQWLQPVSKSPLVLRQLPIFKDGIVTGFVDLALERAHIYRELAESSVIELPKDLADLEKSERFAMLEKLADHDDELMEQLLADLSPPPSRVFEDLSRELADGLITPVLFGSAEHGHGVGRLLKTLRHDAPEVGKVAARHGISAAKQPILRVIKSIHTAHGGKLSLARVLAGEIQDSATVVTASGLEGRAAGLFQLQGQTQNKTTKAVAGETVALGKLDQIPTGAILSTAPLDLPKAPRVEKLAHVYGLAVFVSDRKDEVKLAAAINKLCEEDPSYALEHNHETHEMVLWGQGEMHLRVGMERLSNRFGVTALARPRQVAYKETIRKPVTIRGRHKKQSGGHGQYGDITVQIAPLTRGQGFKFTDTISGGVVPKQYIPAVEAGIRDWMGKGPLGFPVVDFTVNLNDGSYHDVDSSEMAFKTAARIAMSEGAPQCAPVLLEPIVAIEIHAPSDATARVNQIVSGHRGQLMGYDAREGWPGWDTVKAQMPESELAQLIIELRSATAGVGTFNYSFDHMAEMSGRAAEQVVQSRTAH
jgi:elongation factor G